MSSPRSATDWAIQALELLPEPPSSRWPQEDDALLAAASHLETASFRWSVDHYLCDERAISIDEHKRLAREAFSSWLDVQFAELENVLKSGTAMLVKVGQPSSMHLDWLIAHHVDRKPYGQIERAPGNHVSDDTIRSRVCHLNRIIGLRRS